MRKISKNIALLFENNVNNTKILNSNSFYSSFSIAHFVSPIGKPNWIIGNCQMYSNNIIKSKPYYLKNGLNFKLKGLQEYNKILNLYFLSKKYLILKMKINKFSFINDINRVRRKGLEYPIQNGLISPIKLIWYNDIENNKPNQGIQYKFNKVLVNPISPYRLSNQTKYNILIKNINILLFNSFLLMNSLISKPMFNITSEKVIIHLFFYLFKINKQNYNDKNITFININRNRLKILTLILSHLFKKPVELNLNRIYYPYFDSNIFVNFLGNIINKIQVRKIFKIFFNKAKIKNPFKLNRKIIVTKIPSLLSGINIKIAGRLLTHRIIPKKTINFVRRGALARVKINYLDKARYTNKNKRGAFSITISTGQILS